MSQTIDIYTDYVCPYCLLAERIVRPVLAERGLGVRWRPFELRPYPTPTLRVEDPYLPRVWRQSVYPMAERLGVDITLPAISPQPRTDKAFELFQLAERDGLGDAYSVRALRAFFQEQRDLGDPEVLVALAGEVGLDPEEARHALDAGTYREAHRQALQHAYSEMNITGVPTLVAGGVRLTGVPDRQRLERALDGQPAASLTG
jgi:predicted DsbA family dithiol-disulfide isomerase